LADERPPAGGDATDFEAAAKAANAKAKKTTTRVRAAARETRAAQSEVDATARAADELARERERLNKEIQKVAHRLRSADRRMEGVRNSRRPQIRNGSSRPTRSTRMSWTGSTISSARSRPRRTAGRRPARPRTWPGGSG
jgi:hypothetical protein